MIGVSKKSKYIYSNKIASKRNIQSLSVDNLMGVDYSSSMLNIQDNHAYDIKNFLKKNGTLQKRPPVEQVGIKGLNGVWECHFKGKKYVIVHKDKNLYLVNNIDEYDSLAENYTLINGTGTIYDTKSWGVFTNDRLYILCGSYVVVKFSDTGLTHCNVYNDVDTYVPTTTIGITEIGSTLGINRTTLDAPNLMTSKRYNSIFAVVKDDMTHTYQLDSTISYGDNPKVIITFYDTTDKAFITKELSCYKEEVIDNDRKLKVFKTSFYYLNEDNFIKLFIESWEKYDETMTDIVDRYYSNELNVEIGGTRYQLNADEMLEDNIKILFEDSLPNESHLIERCTFGVMYGAGGNRNRLFLSGNPDKPNVDYHTSRRNIYASDSDVDLLDSQDLTYFSVYDYCGYGTSNTAITDYQIMGDGSLMVLKEESPNEPNIYFRDSNYETKTIALGDAETQVVEETYPMRVGNIGEGAINGFKDTLHNLNNDLVFVSDNGVFGISSTVSAGMLNSDYKYSYGRSRLINSKLKDDLIGAKNIATIVYDHKYFLTIKKKDDTYITYVADGRYPYKLKDSIDNEYEYEWFVLDGINADKYHTINGTLYYSSDNGLFLFNLHNTTSKYIDVERINLEAGTATYVNGITDITTSSNGFLILDETDSGLPIDKINNSLKTTVTFKTYGRWCFARMFLIKFNKGKITIPSNYKKIFDSYKDKKMYLYDMPDNSFVEFEAIENEYDDTYDVVLKGTTSMSLEGSGSDYVYVDLYNQELELVKKEFGYIFVDQYGNEITHFGSRDSESITFAVEGYLNIYNNISCYYLTKSYNFGQSVYFKYLKSMTMINDSEQLSYTNFGIITKEVKKRFEDNTFSGTNGLVDTYENIFKADLTTGRFSTSFTKDYLLKFNFIQFEFYNNDDTNCIINNFTILYTTGFKTKGVS